MCQIAKLDYSKEYVLEDDFVKLTPLAESHILPLSKISKDAEIWKYFFEQGDTVPTLTNYIKKAIKNRTLAKEHPYAVFDKRCGKFAGTTRWYEYSDDLKTVKLGHTWYGKPFRGSGINRHCKYLLFEFAFERLEVERIGFGAYIDNLVSVAAMKSVGCQKEGVLKNVFPAIEGNGRTDAILMSILKDDWSRKVKSELTTKIYT